MINIPKYKTIEVKEFPLCPNYSGDPFSEYKEYCQAIEQREKDVYNYYAEKLGAKRFICDYPKRTTVIINGKRAYFHISTAHYSADTKYRVLISNNDINDDITVIFQTAIEKNAERKN